MSHDLVLAGGAGKRLDRKSFVAYFRNRRHYEVGEVGNGQAVYQHEDTGVSFIFDEPEDGLVMFNLNYFRPHVFGLDAAVELEDFSKAFDARVTDPQEGTDGAAFSREDFLRSWNAGNQFAYRSLLKEQTEPVFTWPGRRIRKVWEWNYTRPPDEEREAQTLFVPGIFAVEIEGEARSVAIWPPDCAILLPAADAVLVPCEPRGRTSEDLALVTWD